MISNMPTHHEPQPRVCAGQRAGAWAASQEPASVSATWRSSGWVESQAARSTARAQPWLISHHHFVGAWRASHSAVLSHTLVGSFLQGHACCVIDPCAFEPRFSTLGLACPLQKRGSQRQVISFTHTLHFVPLRKLDSFPHLGQVYGWQHSPSSSTPRPDFPQLQRVQHKLILNFLPFCGLLAFPGLVAAGEFFLIWVSEIKQPWVLACQGEELLQMGMFPQAYTIGLIAWGCCVSGRHLITMCFVPWKCTLII